MFFASNHSKPGAKGKPRKSKKFAAPLDRRRKDIRKEEEQLQRQKGQLERFLQDAPRQREKQMRNRHEQIAIESRKRPNLVENGRYDALLRENPNFGNRPLRWEKKKGLYVFLFLVAVLFSVVIWIFRLLL